MATPIENRQNRGRVTVRVPIDPDRDCRLCPRLAAFRDENRRQNPEWFNSPVPIFGNADAGLVIIGLAPGMQGANRTGRPFTGDYAGDLLFGTLLKAGLANGVYKRHPDDGLTLHNTMIVNAVRCVPPKNKPVGAEISQCRQFLAATLDAVGRPRTFVALGRIAHDSLLTTLGHRRSDYKFAHAARHDLSDGSTLFDSYHCSRYNTNTGRLTTDMFEDVVFAAARHTGQVPES